MENVQTLQAKKFNTVRDAMLKKFSLYTPESEIMKNITLQPRYSGCAHIGR